jgi:hypothetical protein
MNRLIQRIKYWLKMLLWVANGYLGKRFSLAGPERLTVLITYFNPARMTQIDHQLRHIFKCSFVQEVIISNHNPDINIQGKIKVRDRRLKILNQPVRQGCGFRWQIANEFNPDYLVVIDDDLFVSPEQLTKLFRFLLAEPEIPHGLSGINYLSDGSYEFRDRENRETDFLCEIYALTNEHLGQYMKIYEDLSSNKHLVTIINSTTDFILLSHTGSSRPKIHDVGRLFRDGTFKTEGVAVHKSEMFKEYIELTQDAIRDHNLSRVGITAKEGNFAG